MRENKATSSDRMRRRREDRNRRSSISRADSQQSVRIFDKSCGLFASQNRLGTVFLGLKVADSKPIWQKIPMTNPHRSSKIRTTESKSAQ